MTARTTRLHRLLAIRRLHEELDRGSLQTALAEVAEVEAALEQQKATQSESQHTARLALSDGDRFTWLMADAQGEVAGWNLRRLRTLLASRIQAVSEADRKLRQSRQERQQVERLVEMAGQMQREDEGRRAQAAADDWFLARQGRTED